jgi:zinc/manganese transport system permease protein
MALSVVLAVITVWIAIAASFETNWPVGFFVGTGGAVCYAAGRLVASWRGARGQVSRA